MRRIAVFLAALCGMTGIVHNVRAQDVGGAFTHQTPPSAPVNATRFHPNPAVRAQDLAAFVAKTRASNPQEADAMKRTFAKKDPFARLAPSLKRYSLRTDDVADAITLYLVTAWYAVRGRKADASSAQVRGVCDQTRRKLLASPAFTSASDASKQQMGEAALVQAMIADALVTAGKRNRVRMPQIKNAIKQEAMNSFGLNLFTMKLTKDGLHP